MKRIVIIAIILQVLKDLVLRLAVNYLPEPRGSLETLYYVTVYVLILPEMIVSYENGPHGIPAKVIMFMAGTIANLVVVAVVFLVWKGIKGMLGQATTPNRKGVPPVA